MRSVVAVSTGYANIALRYRRGSTRFHVSHAEYSPGHKIALDGASPGQPRSVMWHLREVFGDFSCSDFVSLTLTGIGFALGIYAVTIP